MKIVKKSVYKLYILVYTDLLRYALSSMLSVILPSCLQLLSDSVVVEVFSNRCL